MTTKETFLEVRMQLDLTQAAMAKRLGITRPYLSSIENGRPPSEQLVRKLLSAKELIEPVGRVVEGRRRRAAGQGVPVVSWARAGTAASYDEIPFDWQETIASDCPDAGAFGLVLEGDSMEPKYFAGDVVILMPQRQPQANQLVAAKIRDRGVVFKMLNILTSPTRFRLSSYNSEMYSPNEYIESDFEWIYPAYEVRRRLWHQ